MVVLEHVLEAHLPHGARFVHLGAGAQVENTRWMPIASVAVATFSRKAFSLNICASSDKSSRCSSVACSGTSSTNTCSTGLPSAASNGIGCSGRRVSTSLALPLVPRNLPVELVGQRIDRRVHVGFDALGVDFLAADVKVAGDLLPELVDRQPDVDVDHVVEVARNTLELGRYVFANGGRDQEVMAGQV